LWLRELRLWLSLSKPRPSIKATFIVGFIAGGLNTLLPGRGGDLAAIPMLKRSAGVKTSDATHAIGITSALEALVFGALICIALVTATDEWGGKMSYLLQETLNSAMTLSFILLSTLTIGAFIAKSIRPQAALDNPGFLSFLKALLIHYRQSLADKFSLGSNAALALIEVWLMVLSFAWGFHALNIIVPTPWTVAAIIMGGSAFAAVALPPSYGAGPTAVCLFVLGAIGMNEHVALAYSAMYWIISQLPLLIFAGPCVWLYKARLFEEDTAKT